jgi:hypothetical protein
VILQLTTNKTKSDHDSELGSPPMWLENFIFIYQSLSVDNLSGLTKLYHQDVTFQDPIHQISGFQQLKEYFENLYQNVNSCTFVINQVLHEGNQAAIYWTMIYTHHRLNAGEPIKVEGSSLIMGDNDKVVYHRDYIDLGQMLYEHIPVLGRVIRWLKVRASR